MSSVKSELLASSPPSRHEHRRYRRRDLHARGRKRRRDEIHARARQGLRAHGRDLLLRLDGRRAGRAEIRRSTYAPAEVRTPYGYQRLRARDMLVSFGSYSAPFLRPYGIVARHLSGTRVFRNDPARRPQPGADHEPDRRPVQAGLFQSRRPPARCRHCRTVRLRLQPQRRTLQRHPRQRAALFPDAGDFNRASFWTGLRPTTPSNLPIWAGRATATYGSTPDTGRLAGRWAQAPASASSIWLWRLRMTDRCLPGYSAAQ